MVEVAGKEVIVNIASKFMIVMICCKGLSRA